MELNQTDIQTIIEIVIVGTFTAGFFGYLIWKMGNNPDNHGKWYSKNYQTDRKIKENRTYIASV